MGVTIIDDFNSYSDGDLNGNGGWTAPTSYDVQGSVVQEGSKAVVNTVDTATSPLSVASVTSGIFGCYMRTTQTSVITGFYLGEGSTDKANISFNGGNIQIQGTTIQAHSADTWYFLEIEIKPSTNEIRGRVDGGTWSAWVSAASSFSAIDYVKLKNFSPATGSVYYDKITYDDGAVTVAKTVTAKARVKDFGVIKTSTAKARVKDLGVIKTSTAKARVKDLGVDKTVTAKASIMNGNQKTIQAKARVKDTGVEKTITAKARVKDTGIVKTVTSKARVKDTGVAKTVTAKARVCNSVIKTIQTKAAINVDNNLKLVTSKARLKKSDISSTIQARLRVKQTVALTFTGKARIRAPRVGLIRMPSKQQSYPITMDDGRY